MKRNTAKKKKKKKNLAQKQLTCLVNERKIDDTTCLKFQVGERIGAIRANDFEPSKLPCLKCEHMVRPVRDSLAIRAKLGSAASFLSYTYNGSFVFSDSFDTLNEKITAMLKQMGQDDAFINTEIADNLAVYNKHSEAVAYYEKAIQQQPSDRLFFKLGKAHYNLGNYETAIRNFQTAVHMDADFYYWLGRCYQQTGDIEHAFSYYEEAYQLDSAHAGVIEAIANYYWNKINKHELNSQSLLKQATLFMDKLVNQRLSIRKRQLAQLPGNQFIHDEKDKYFIQLANIHYLSGNFTKAIQSIEKYTRLFPFTSKEDITAAVHGGDLLMDAHDALDKMKQKTHIRKTTEFFQQQFANLYEILANCFYLTKDYDQAQLMIDRTIAFDHYHPKLAELSSSIKSKMEEQDKDERLERLEQLFKEQNKRVDTLEVEMAETKVDIKDLKAHVARLEELVDHLSRSIEDVKAYVDERMNLASLIVKEAMKSPDWKDRFQFVEELLEKDTYRQLQAFDQRTDQTLKQNFSNVEDIVGMGKIVDVWATGEWLYRHHQDFFKQLDQDIKGMDASFIVVSYFKALEILLAKKIGAISKGEHLLYFDHDTKKAFPYKPKYSNRPLVIGEDSEFYHKETIGSYNTFIRNYNKDQYKPYKAKYDPIKEKCRGNRVNLFHSCNNFTKEHRNKCSHKIQLSTEEVDTIRNEFNSLMNELLTSLKTN